MIAYSAAEHTHPAPIANQILCRPFFELPKTATTQQGHGLGAWSQSAGLRSGWSGGEQSSRLLHIRSLRWSSAFRRSLTPRNRSEASFVTRSVAPCWWERRSLRRTEGVASGNPPSRQWVSCVSQKKLPLEFRSSGGASRHATSVKRCSSVVIRKSFLLPSRHTAFTAVGEVLIL